MGVVDVDQIMFFPDFRAYERAFQLVTQVAGRAGRRDVQGKVTLQTRNSGHPLIRKIINNDYLALYNDELQDREVFKYTPFYRLIKIVFKHKKKDVVSRTSLEFRKRLDAFLPELRNDILGPEPPIIERIRDQYIKHVIVKLSKKDNSWMPKKRKVAQVLEEFRVHTEYKKVHIYADVDFYT